MEKAGNPGEDFLLGGGDKLYDDFILCVIKYFCKTS